MRGTGIHALDNVSLAGGHAGYTLAASVLRRISIRRQALDVSLDRLGQHTFLVGDEILNIHLARYRGDLGAALVGKLVAQIERFGLYNILDLIFVGKYCLALLYKCVLFGKLFLYLYLFHTGKTSERHLHDGGGLNVVQTEPFAQRCLTVGNGLARAYDLYYLVDEIERDFQSFKDMRALHRLFHIETGAFFDYLALEGNVVIEHFL